MAFEELKVNLLDRILRILENEHLQHEEERAVHANKSSSSLIHQAMMKAVCYSQQWVRQVSDSAVPSSLPLQGDAST